MPTLTWVGKDKVIHHHRDVPYRVLNKLYNYGQPDSRTAGQPHDNRIIHGDNLEALKSLIPEFDASIDCIYIDPPYNTGNEGWAYSDAVNDPKILKWIGEVVGKEGEDLSRHDKWLCMMYPRLVLLKRLLKNSGVLLVSIGDDEFATLNLVLDEIFGKNCHLATFVWKSRAKPVNIGEAKHRPQRVSEYVLVYGKKPDQVKFQSVLSGEDRSYPHTTADGRKYRLQTILKSNRGENERNTMRFPIAGYIPPPTQRWQGGEAFIQGLLDSNHLEFRDGTPFRRYFEDEEAAEHAPLYTFMDPEITGTAEIGKMLLNKIMGNTHGFDTVKPLGVLECLIQACAPKNALVLDSFGGSGSTAHAVLNLNARDQGTRRFIMVEMMDYAETITAERVRRAINGYVDGNKEVAGLGGGFDFYTVGERLLQEDGMLNPAVGLPAIRDYVAWTEGIPIGQCAPLVPAATEGNRSSPYWLGEAHGLGVFFVWDDTHATTLDLSLLTQLVKQPGRYLIYADQCALSEDFMRRHGVAYKKIPRDITRL